jgi:hypothetical protein
MNAATALLAEVRRCGADVAIRGGRLGVRPASRVPEPLFERLRRHKAEVIALLSPAVESPEDFPPACEGRPASAVRVVVVERRPVKAPLELRPGIPIVDLNLAVRAELARLQALGEAYAEAGDDARAARVIAERIEDAIETLERCGVRARLEPIQ